MAEENHNQVELAPSPYGYWPDGRPITQLEASAKLMDDWATRHGFSGSVRMGIGSQQGEPKEWRGVKIGSDKALQQPPSPLRIEPNISVPEQISKPEPILEPAPIIHSWLRKLLNLFKGNH